LLIDDIFLFFDLVINRVISSKIDDIFSIFIPNKSEDIVVAILLPNTIPTLELNVNKFALIRAIVSIIRAELDWINIVEIKPVKKEDLNDFVSVVNLFFTLSIEAFIREEDIDSRE